MKALFRRLAAYPLLFWLGLLLGGAFVGWVHAHGWAPNPAISTRSN